MPPLNNHEALESLQRYLASELCIIAKNSGDDALALPITVHS